MRAGDSVKVGCGTLGAVELQRKARVKRGAQRATMRLEDQRHHLWGRRGTCERHADTNQKKNQGNIDSSTPHHKT